MRKKSACLMLRLAFAAAFLACLPASAALAQDEVQIAGLYSNPDYAYSVILPAGLVGFRDPPPSPNHGFGIELPKTRGFLWVDGSHNASFHGSLRSAVDGCLEGLKRESKDGSVELMREQARLAGLPAMHTIARFRDWTGSVMVEEMVMAFRTSRSGGGPEIIYTVGLRTSEGKIGQDRTVLGELCRSFKLLPLR